jgi:hypothetical protein
VGRRGFQYPFDTAVALRGLIAHERAGGRVEEPEALARMFGFIADSMAARRAVIPEVAEERWSTRFSPHLMKLVIVCSEWKARTGDARADAVFAALHRELLPRAIDWLDGAEPRYSHSVCYATEAMLHLAQSGVPGSAEGAAQAARWLSGIQTSEGGIPAWSLPGPETRLASDATAQAICIWDAVDRERYAGEIENAFSHLARMQHATGGIRYSEHRDDVNSWCTIFTMDALRAAKPWT